MDNDKTPEEIYQEKLKEWERKRFAPPPEPDPVPFEPTLTTMAPMRDGIKLYTEVFLPEGYKPDGEGSALPTILMRSPYPYTKPSRNDRLPIQPLVEAGFAVVFQLTRGQGESEGVFHFFRDDVEDGYDGVEWIAAQPWSDGNVGMMGSSYAGGVQLLAARSKPPALKCIMPTAFVGNYTRCFPFSHGVPNKGPYMQWHQVADAKRWDDVDVAYNDMRALEHPKWGPAFRKRPLIDAAEVVLPQNKFDSWRETISNPLDSDFWAPIHFTDEQLTDLDIPIFMTDGWYDMTIGPIDYFQRMEAKQPDNEHRYLLVGPWNHYQCAKTSEPGADDGDRILPDNGVMDLTALRIAFFNRYLKGDVGAEVMDNRVKVFVAGSKGSNANVWRSYPTFPVPGTKTKEIYLHSGGKAHFFPDGDGTLDWDLPGEEPADHYQYNPDVSTASQVEYSGDRRQVEMRTDVLKYTSAPLMEPLTILGDMSLVLHAASDCTDTDWFVVVTEVFPDGESRSFHYAPPAFRARYREGFDKEVFLTPDKPEEFHIPLGPAGHQIAAGNCLRVSIFSSAFPEYEPNSNTGNPAATDTGTKIANQTVYHDRLRPSHLVLPVIDL